MFAFFLFVYLLDYYSGGEMQQIREKALLIKWEGCLFSAASGWEKRRIEIRKEKYWLSDKPLVVWPLVRPVYLYIGKQQFRQTRDFCSALSQLYASLPIVVDFEAWTKTSPDYSTYTALLTAATLLAGSIAKNR